MIYSIALEVMCCLFLLLTGVFCVNYGRRLSVKLDWCRYRWQAFVVIGLCYLIGAYHLFFGILKTFYTLMDFV